MEAFVITVNDQDYLIKPALHKNFYSLSYGNKSAMLGKNIDGTWEATMQTSEAFDIPAQEIGKAIENHVSS